MSTSPRPERPEGDDTAAGRWNLTATSRWRLSTFVATLALVVEAASLLLYIPNSSLASATPLGFNGVAGFVFGAMYPIVGWLIVSKSRARRLGWVFLASGLFQAMESFGEQYATYGLLGRHGVVPFADVASWVGTWIWIPGLLLLVPAILLFPDGRLPGPRWRPVLWATVLSLALMLPPTFIALWPYRGVALVADTLPASISDAVALATSIRAIGLLLLLLIAVATILGVIVRFRRSTGIERQQLKWFASAAVLVVVSTIFFSGDAIPAPFAELVALVVSPLLPAAIGIAVLRYRLYDIDVVIRRTLVYVPLTALLAGLYAATIGISQRLFIAVTGNASDGAVILSTLILATTFTPIKNAIQGRVDRGFRDAQDVERRLATFTDAVAADWSTPDPARSLRAFLAAAVAAVEASGGAAYVTTPHGEQPVGPSPSRRGVPIVHVAVEAGERHYGRIELGARVRGGSFSDRDLAALRLAGERLAMALSGVGDASAPGIRAPASPATTVTSTDAGD